MDEPARSQRLTLPFATVSLMRSSDSGVMVVVGERKRRASEIVEVGLFPLASYRSRWQRNPLNSPLTA